MPRKMILALAAAFAVAGCGHIAPALGPPVVVAVPTSCIPKTLGPPPKYSASLEDLRKATPGQRYALAVGGFIERDQRLKETEPAIDACR